MRERVWRGVADGRVRVVVGARSALFLPFAELGLIVVDEEHDLAYKQEDRVFYNARDMAVVRGHLAGFPGGARLGDAVDRSRGSTPTPAATRGSSSATASRDAKLPEIARDRHAGATRPSAAASCRRRWSPRSPRRSPSGQQALLFLNRRGYAPLTLCRACGHRFQCPNCSTWLVEHRFRGVLVCHHCGHSERRPDACPNCGDDREPGRLSGRASSGSPRRSRRAFPAARTIVLSSDIARRRASGCGSSSQRSPRARSTSSSARSSSPRATISRYLTLVGVVDADLGLAFGDLRAAERTFQLLTQVTGRAGRAGGASRALVQTYAPEHPVIAAIVSGDREAFYAREIAARRAAGLPPFGRLAAHRRLRPGPRLGARLRQRASAAPRRPSETIMRARPGRSAARGDARPPPLPPARPGAAERRHAGLHARPGSRRRRRRAAGCGCRSTSTRRGSCETDKTEAIGCTRLRSVKRIHGETFDELPRPSR